LVVANSATQTGGPDEMGRSGDGGKSISRSSDGRTDELPASYEPRGRAIRYRMSSDLAALGTDFLILNDEGENVFRIDGQSISEKDTICIEDLDGHVRFRILAHFARTTGRLAILDENGAEIGAVLRQPISPLRDRFSIELMDDQSLSVDGNVANHEFSIVSAEGHVAEVSRKWFRALGSFGVEIAPGQEDALLIATIVAMDVMIHGSD
jgi:uncharacterized protein YxjI